MKTHVRSLLGLINQYTPNPTRGAEVGVWKGKTSADLCRCLPGCHLSMVDTWANWAPGTSYRDSHKVMGDLTDEEWQKAYEEAVRAIESVPDAQYTIMRATSEVASKEIKDQSLDFVFLDANHTYEEVKKDIELWFPLVRSGGLVMGHDYKGFYDRTGVWGVSRAVHEIFGEKNVIPKEGRIWAIVKK